VPTTFKRFCSLGWNCEPGLYLRAASFPERRDYFKWTATNFEALCLTIQSEFSDAYLRENISIVGIMVLDKKYHMATHPPKSSHFPGATDEDILDATYKEKQFLAHRFLEEIRGNDPIAYVLKYIDENGKQDAIRLRSILAQKGAHSDSLLIFVQEERNKERPWNIPGIVNLYIERFASFEETENIPFEAWHQALMPFAVLERPSEPAEHLPAYSTA
jgi:hypothetical protein